MAFTDVSTKMEYLKLTDLEVGEAIEGYFLEGKASDRLEGAYNLIMMIGDERKSVSAAGNVKYLIIDGKLKGGLLTRITREEDTKNGKGKKVTRFKVEQDGEKVLTNYTVGLSTPHASPAASMADKIAKMKGG